MNRTEKGVDMSLSWDQQVWGVCKPGPALEEEDDNNQFCRLVALLSSGSIKALCKHSAASGRLVNFQVDATQEGGCSLGLPLGRAMLEKGVWNDAGWGRVAQGTAPPPDMTPSLTAPSAGQQWGGGSNQVRIKAEEQSEWG